MIRPLHIWIGFGLCLGVVLATMGWISFTVIRLDQAEIRARQQAAIEENVRLSLWRMDSALAPLVVQESARPYFWYTAFYPAQRAYTRMFNVLEPGEILVPSPLLTQSSPYILLHFQIAPDGAITSPQVPTGQMRGVAQTNYSSSDRIQVAADRLNRLSPLLHRDEILPLLPRTRTSTAPAIVAQPLPQPGPQQQVADGPDQQVRQSLPQSVSPGDDRQIAQAPQRKTSRERMARVQQQQELNIRNIASNVLETTSNIAEGVVHPLWIADTLVLARHVSVNGQDYVQGCWLDWLAIRKGLLASVNDLLPAPTLEPVKTDPDSDQQARMLAALPVRLLPGPLPADPLSPASPVRLSLLIAWGGMLLAVGAVAALLGGAVALSERRGAFVSAVTHELRTPLTTFCLYTDLLAEGKIPDPNKRQRYLNTLRAEADRLKHLVENVLAYARLERGRARGRTETVRLPDLLSKVTDRLEDRTRQAGMTLEVEPDEAAPPVAVRADTSAVEQILFNLVDNACKYAASAEPRTLHLQAQRRGRFAVLRVRDHGPGISKTEAGRLFRPFCKSARDAANSAPGVGLGLALSRRLAREMGGRLYIDSRVVDGACFVLTLPIAG